MGPGLYAGTGRDEMPVPVLYNNPWAAAVPIEEANKGWGVFMTGMAYRWQADGKLYAVAGQVSADQVMATAKSMAAVH